MTADRAGNAGSRDRVTGIVLAGGRSSRFGADKLAIDVCGSTVLERAVAAVAKVAGEVIVAGPDREPPGISGIAGSAEAAGSAAGAVRTIPDREPFGGPLQALAGALDATATELAIAVAGDMPALVPEVLALLLAELRSTPRLDAVTLADPRNPSRLQPLPIALRVGPARVAARAALRAGDRSLVRLLRPLAVAEIPVGRWQPLDPEARTLVDIDLPDDLRRL